jgi:hypothetical protein
MVTVDAKTAQNSVKKYLPFNGEAGASAPAQAQVSTGKPSFVK